HRSRRGEHLGAHVNPGRSTERAVEYEAPAHRSQFHSKSRGWRTGRGRAGPTGAREGLQRRGQAVRAAHGRGPWQCQQGADTTEDHLKTIEGIQAQMASSTK